MSNTPDSSTAPVVVEAHPLTTPKDPHDPTGILRILQFAVETKVDVETIERLVALKERADDRQAAAEFHAAMAAFQAECPPIAKTSRAKVAMKGGGEYGYSYAELDQIANTTRPFLTKNGLSYSWDSKTKDGMIEVVCKVSHVGGHSRTASFTSPTKALTSAMSAQQEVAAALTYARRQSLIQALGLTTCDPDTDGAGAEKINDAQMMEFEDTITRIRLSDADRTGFLAYMGVASVADIRQSDIGKARAALKAKEIAAKGRAK